MELTRKIVNAIHENCSKTQKKVDEKMIHRHLAMFTPALYEKDEKVLVRNPEKLKKCQETS